MELNGVLCRGSDYVERCPTLLTLVWSKLFLHPFSLFCERYELQVGKESIAAGLVMPG
jgi:hypothetical protein